MHFAHSLDGKDRRDWQSLAGHLREVSSLTAERGAKFGAERLGALIGLLHDLGKYSADFQAYIEGKSSSPDHATAGAREIRRVVAGTTSDRIAAAIGAYCIAGHHAGLPDWRGERPLSQRLEKPLPTLDEAWSHEIEPRTERLFPNGFKRHTDKALAGFQLAMFGRMLFSCLVDADFCDTERFYAVAEGKNVDREWPALAAIVEELRARFDAHLAGLSANAGQTELNQLRADILAHARAKATQQRGIFTLNVPTGGGKTLTSLGFALDHAKAHGLQRVVYAIPFTSIIDQTAVIFRTVLGEGIVLEHHSAIDNERRTSPTSRDEGERDAAAKMRLAMEDWAAPVIVTTNVQLFESLFANRPSRCRKLHNLVNAVIVLDEAQAIPLPLLRPCVAALDELTRNYGCSVILCTATQPALAAPHFPGGFTLPPERELAPDPALLGQALKRVTLSLCKKPLTDAELTADLHRAEQGLVIVNSRKHALDLYNAAKAEGLAGLVHLSTRQTATDRRRLLAAIRDNLNRCQPCRVIATSLVEAGVDLDFPRVWRAQAGLDQIAQAAGRCNREGRRTAADSIVTVFAPADAKPPPEIKPLIDAMARIIPYEDDLFAPKAIERYFREVYWQRGDARLDRISVRKADGPAETMSVLGAFLLGKEPDFAYRTVAEGFRLIESGMAPVIIAAEETPRATIERLRHGSIAPAAAARDLQTFIVQVPPLWRDKLIHNGHAAFVSGYGEQFAVLTNTGLYTPERGLLWEEADLISDSII